MKRVVNASSFLFLFLALLSAFVVSSCAVEETADTSADTADGDDSDDVADDGTIGEVPTGSAAATSEYFEVTVVENINYLTQISKNGDGSTECRVLASGEDILCIVDMHELDLWFRVVQLNDTMPEDLCEYRQFMPYFYNSVPVGAAPTAVLYEVDGDNVIQARDPDGAGDATATADIWYYFSGIGWRTHEFLFGTAARSSDALKCPWDYTERSNCGKNCCFGPYYKTVITPEDVADGWEEWPGEYGNCFAGPAMDSEHPKDPSTGMPMFLISNVDQGGLSNIFKVDLSFNNGFGNINKANYFNPDEHPQTGAIPDVPGTFLAARDLYNNSRLSHSGYFQYDCLNSNEEVTARIRVMIREWNTKDQLLALLAGTLTADPDVAGTETDLTAPDTYPRPNPGPYGDRADWKDYKLAADAAPNSWNYRAFGFADFSADPDAGGPYTAGTAADYLFFNSEMYVGYICDENTINPGAN